MDLTIEQALERGLQLQQAGNGEQAELLYRNILAAAPNQADAWHLLGAIAFERGDFQTAIEQMGRAAALQPQNSQFLGNLGLAQTLAKRLDDAEQTFAAALSITPQDAELWFKAGNVKKAKQDNAEAENCYRRAIRLQPQMAVAYSNLGAVLVEQRKISTAIETLKQAIVLAPQQPESHFNLAMAFQNDGQFLEAEKSCRQAAALRPREVSYLLGLADLISRQKRHDEAEQIARHATQLAPQNATAWRCLGAVLTAARKQELAEHAIREAIRLQPDDAVSYDSLCVVLHDLGKLDEAIAAGQRAIELAPSSATAHDNLGAALSRRGDFDEAVRCLERAIELEPELAMAHFHLALTRLLLGDFDQGWREYEWRFRHPQSVRREVDAPRWQGESLAGRSILLQAEQGFGDTLQFIRYAKLLREQGAKVILECSPALIDFLEYCQVVDELVANTAPLPCPDFYCPLLSLGNVLKIKPHSPALPSPYLLAEAELVAGWRSVVSELPGKKIGLAWQGDPKHTWDRFRSVRLAEFLPLASVPGITLVSVQRGPGEDQLASASFPIFVFQPPLDNYEASFRDTAAVLLNLDVLITADTAIAHLAGGLGVPTWLLLNASPDWRWGLVGDFTPWYPTMRLFRQQKLGEWQTVFEQIAAELAGTKF